MTRTEDDLTAMAEEWLTQNHKSWADVRTMQLPIGFVSTLVEHMDEPGKRHAGNWITARTFVKQGPCCDRPRPHPPSACMTTEEYDTYCNPRGTI